MRPMVPIPIRLLTSSCTVRAMGIDPETGYPEPGEPREIRRVRYELCAGVRRTPYQTQDGTTGLLFIDAANSPGAFEVPAGSLVSVDGGPECCVAACRRYEDGGCVHHWEVELR